MSEKLRRYTPDWDLAAMEWLPTGDYIPFADHETEIERLATELASQTNIADNYRCEVITLEEKQAENDTTIAALEESIRSRGDQIEKLQDELAKARAVDDE